MNSKKRNFLISSIFILIAVVFSILVGMIDVKPIGENGTNIGFASINKFIFDTIGVNMEWYYVTDLLGIISIFIAIIYAIIGLIQLIKRKSILKVDKEFIILGLFYLVVILLYVFFEQVIVNYRPILIDGLLEASYPSSHTLMTICICSSSIIINKKLFNNKITKSMNIISLIIIVVTVIGRLLSGVHWFTDIIGGILFSIAVVMTLYSVINEVKHV